MPRKTELPADFFEVDFFALFKKEGAPHIRIRYLGLSHIQEGATIEYVASILRVSPRAVTYWVQRYKDLGLEGLRDKEGRGAKTKLPKNKENNLCDKVIALQEQRKGGRVKAQDIQEMLEKEFNVSCSISGIYLLLKRVGLHWISSRSRHPKQSQEVQDLFKKLRKHRGRCHQCGCIL